MTKDKVLQINWDSPSKQTSARTSLPVVNVVFNPSGQKPDGQKRAAYWRLTFNKAFMEKFYPQLPKIRKIAIKVGGQGILFDVKPVPEQTPFLIKGKNYYHISDREEVEKIFKHCGIIVDKEKGTNIRLHYKPFGTFDSKPIYKLVFIPDENPDITPLERLKNDLEAEENFPEPDKKNAQTIKIEG